ncbi:MAG: hypothetical protein A2293_07020 [Elusimicrobia bacterium RIFOXYB2_FULL_49_7]|nr:MAG: hypothetical protein A2293_07020 [Elusimicrobia bacterium RIFOXYB2_FULL_49_7]
MKPFFLFLLLFAPFCVIAQENAEPALAAEEGKCFGLNFSLSGVNRYLWRGGKAYDGLALQPAVEASYGDFTLGNWNDVNLGDDENNGFAEADFYFSYDKALPCCEKLALSAGYNLYTYPVSYDVEEEAVDHEFSLGLAVDMVGSPYLTYFISPTDGMDGLQYQYLELGGSHDVELRENLNLSLAGTVGYAIPNEGDATATVIGLSISPVYSTVMEIAPIFFYQIPLGDDFESDFYAGLTVSYGLEF